LIVRKYNRSRIIDFKPTDMRICVLRIIGKLRNYSFNLCPCSNKGKESMRAGSFLRETRQDIKQRPSYYIKIIFSDKNTKVGKEIWTGIAHL
jgi:hypothetical protein